MGRTPVNPPPGPPGIPLARPPSRGNPTPGSTAPQATAPDVELATIPEITPATAAPVAVRPRFVLNCVEGWGKTTLAAFAPTPLIAMVAGETGYTILRASGLVPAVATVPITAWRSLLALLTTMLEEEDFPYSTFVIDALTGLERLCHTYICETKFDGDWGEKGFIGWQRGYELAVSEWTTLLELLSEVNRRGVTIILLSHTTVKTYQNPRGADYTRIICDLHPKTWGPTHRWSDAVLFGDFIQVLDEGKKSGQKVKGVGGHERILYTTHRDAFDAKNRFGLQPEIAMPLVASQMWSHLWSYFPSALTGES